jgi:hypothetical protein
MPSFTPKHKEFGKDIAKLAISFTPISNLYTISGFLHKWLWPPISTTLSKLKGD